MATSVWETARLDTVELIEAITPTYDADKAFRCIELPRRPGARARDRQFTAHKSEPIGDVAVFGNNEQQLGKRLMVEVSYTPADDVNDRMHQDELDIVNAISNSGTYPAGLRVRQVARDQVEPDFRDDGSIVKTIPIDHIFRESVTLG